MRISSLAPCFALAASALIGGCDLIESATSTIIVSGLLIASPEVQYPGLFDVKAEVVATSWVGERESGTSTEEPDPISGADVDVSGPAQIQLEEIDSGIYSKTSLEDAALTYQEGATYTFDATVPGQNEAFGGTGVAPPRLQAGDLTFEPALGVHPMIAQLKTHAQNTALRVDWGEQFGRYAYVTVFRAERSAPDRPQQIFDTRPKTAKEVLDFVVGDPPATVDIPAEIFDRDGLYAVVLVAANKGNTRTNTFVGSPYLIGSGAVEVFAIGDIDP